MGYLSKRKFEKYEKYIILVLLFALPFLTIFGTLCAGLDWRFDFLNEFKIQFAVLSLFLFLWCAVKQDWLKSTVFLILTILNVALISSHIYLFQKETKLPPDSHTFTIMLQNLKGANDKLSEIENMMYNTSADVVFWTNVPVEIYRHINQVKGPYQLQNQTYDKTGAMKLILARTPSIDRGQVAQEKGLWISRVVNTRKLTMLLAYIENPWNKYDYEDAKQQIFELSDFARSRDEPVVLIGSFDATGWSNLLKDIEEYAELKPQQTLFNSGTDKPFYSRRPTDHIYTHSGIEVTDTVVENWLNTDFDTLTSTFKITPIRKELEFLELQPILPEEDLLQAPQ